MDSKEKSELVQHLIYHIKDTTKGFDYFLEKWEKLDKEDIESIRNPLLMLCINEMNNPKDFSKSYFEYQKVSDYLIENEEYKPDTKKFVVKNGVSNKAIVKLFMKLDNYGYIDNTNEEIAKLISLIFDINYKTALSYLNNPNQMQKTKDLFG
jgi:hypothetical protein